MSMLVHENLKVHHNPTYIRFSKMNEVYLAYFNLYESIAMNTVAFVPAIGQTAVRVTYSLGLYSLNGSTLSMENSGSYATSGVANSFWASFNMSTTQNLTPGTWWWGFAVSTATSSQASALRFAAQQNYLVFDDGVNAGLPSRGLRLASMGTSSINTSSIQKEGTAGPAGSNQVDDITQFPYIVISA